MKKIYNFIQSKFFYICGLCLISVSLNVSASEEDDDKHCCIPTPAIEFNSYKSVFNGFEEFRIAEKSNFNTSYIPSYYSEEEYDNDQKKTLIIIHDVLGREAYMKACIDNQVIITPLNIENELNAGVYMIVGTSDQKFFKQKLAVE